MGLEVNRAKTRTVRLKERGEGLEYLGYRYSYEADKRGRGTRYLNLAPSPGACARERERIREMVNKHYCFVPIPELIEQVNRQLKGWAAYFDEGRSRPAFRRMNWFVQQRLVRHLNRRSQRPYRPPTGVSWYAHLYHQLGLMQL